MSTPIKGTYEKPICRGCKKAPEDINEYRRYPNPTAFVIKHERLIRGKEFYCTTCYIKAGMPAY